MAETQAPSIQPWHTFTAMFVTFWAMSAYFDHFLMTIVFCVAFGVLAEIYSKTVMEGDETKSPVKIEIDNVADEERKMLKKLEEKKIKQELEILEIMKAEEELERQKKLLMEMSQIKEKDTPEKLESQNPVSEMVEVPVARAVDPVSVVHEIEEDNPPSPPSKDFLNEAHVLDPVHVYEEENDNPPALPSKDFLNITDCENRDLLSRSEDKDEELEVKNEDDEEVEEEFEAPPPVPCRDFFDVTVNDEEDSFVADNFETKDSSHLSLQDQQDTSNFYDDKGIETAAVIENTGSETFNQTQIIGQIEDQNKINNLISPTEEDCQIEPKQCVEDEDEVNNKIVSMLETTMDMMDKRHFPDSEDLISSPENISENEEKLIDFENDPSTDEGVNFEIQHNDDKFENISDDDKANESLLDSPGK